MTELSDRHFRSGWRAYLRMTKWVMTVILSIAVAIAGYCGIIRYSGNVHTVAKGQIYRSAQLGPVQLQQVIERYGIKSVLNLRGASPGESWYDDEMAESKRLNVQHFDYGIWASGIATRKQIDAILRIVRDAPKPLLVHCNGGADRSGLVAALYEAEIEHRPASEAARQLSLRYGHFPYLTSKTGAMDESFWRYVRPRLSIEAVSPDR